MPRVALSLQTLVAAAAIPIGASGVVASPLQDPAKPPGNTSARLPGGASQLQETHGDWRVTCVQPNEQRLCTLSQQQSDTDTRKLVLAIELRAIAADRAEGTIVLPFGLAVTHPIMLQVGNGPSATLRFRTCVPAGCLVSVVFKSSMLAALQQGTALSVKTTSADGLQEAQFTISLNGFASAFSRAVALVKSSLTPAVTAHRL